MAAQPKIKRLPQKELDAHVATLTGSTDTLNIINNGADDKFDLVLIVQDVGGGYGMFKVVPDLPQSASVTIPFSSWGLVVVKFYIRWRDKNGIGRFTCRAEASPRKFYKTMTCYFAAQRPDTTIEEALLFGDELPI